MSKFEEYDLYSHNRSFLATEQVLTFTDTDGKLLALKPDVTLSIIKNFRGNGLEKLYYHENVYRASSMGFREIEQAGLECIGDVDEYCVCEALGLAVKSLMSLSNHCELNISHLGILGELLGKLSKASKKMALELIGRKNTDELRLLLRNENVLAETEEIIIELASLDCPAQEATQRLQEILGGYVSWERLQLFCDTCDFLGKEFPDVVRVDFSTVGDTDYYSGIIFCGYVEGVPRSVLCGGQYDELMARLQKPARAIGFAIYLDLLKPLFFTAPEFDSDALLLYSEDCSAEDIYRRAEELKHSGRSVLVMNSVPEGMKFREIYNVSEGGAAVEQRC